MSTYVLVPGAGGEAWYWDLVAPRLERRGHTAVAVSLPAGDESAGWTEYADAIVAAIGDRTEVILVAQSLAGFSTPLVCDRVPVELLVLVNAMIPKPNETGADWWSNTDQGTAMRDHLTAIGLSPKDAEDDDVLYFHDVPPEIRADAFGRGEPQQSWKPMTEPWPLDAWPGVPTRVLVGRDDRLFPAAFQRRIALERLGIESDVIEGGHLVALSRPDGLVEQLEAYREAATGLME